MGFNSVFKGLKNCKPIAWSLNKVRKSSALHHIYTDWLLIATDTNHQHETKEPNYACECSVMRKGGKTSNPLQQYFQKERNKENHISIV